MDSSNLVTIIFLVAAVFVFVQLRNVLGTRTGHEQSPDQFRRPEADDAPVNESDSENDNVITLPGMGDNPGTKYKMIDRYAKPGSGINNALRSVKDADPSFDAKEFLAGASMAYEMIVMAFADGDRRTLENLLSAEVYEGFDQALTDREARGESVRTNFVGIEDISYEGAEMRDSESHITVNVVSQLISSTVGSDGELIDGDAEAVVEVKDVWTFARDTLSNNPNWKLVATESED
ncbi:MAG: Tim44/TimA family putative adaptor protein [Pseudomonadota bacterium]